MVMMLGPLVGAAEPDTARRSATYARADATFTDAGMNSALTPGGSPDAVNDTAPAADASRTLPRPSLMEPIDTPVGTCGQRPVMRRGYGAAVTPSVITARGVYLGPFGERTLSKGTTTSAE